MANEIEHFSRIAFFTACSVVLALLCASCTADDAASVPVGAIAFTVEGADGIVTRSAGDLTTAGLTSMSVWAHNTGVKDFAGLTSGDAGWTPDFMYGQEVTKANGSWGYVPVKYWPKTAGDKLSFFALAPVPSESNGITALAEDYDGGYPQISVTPLKDAGQQQDVCVASSTDRTSDAGAVPFTFAHALTKVTFAARCSDALDDGISLQLSQIMLRNVHSTGTLVFTAQPSGFTWNIDAAVTDYAIDQQSGGLLGQTLTASAQNYSSQSGALLLLPQTLPDNAAIDVYVSLMKNNIPITVFVAEAGIGGMTWPAGKGVDYSLDIDVDALTITAFTVGITDWVDAKTNEGFEIH
jgi:hypothetical protein